MNGRSDKETLFAQILEAHRAQIGIIARINARDDHRQDLEQEILLALWNSLDCFEGRASLKTWFYAVASNAVHGFLRRRKRSCREVGIAAAERASTCRNGGNRDPMAILEEFTMSLDETDRIIFLMYLEDLSYSEMAETLEMQEPALRARVSRLKKRYESRYVGS